MSDLDMLKKQHGEVRTILQTINALISAELSANAYDIAYNLNALSGKLKMHLMSEDKFLYPALMRSDNSEVKATAQSFHEEMGNLAEVLASFVQQYNTPNKILQNKDSFLTDSKELFDRIEERIHREDHKLYPLMASLPSHF